MQKTAYEMRMSYWSSDVCASDLMGGRGQAGPGARPRIVSQSDRGPARSGRRRAATLRDEGPDQQDDHGADHRADQAGALVRPVPAELLANPGGDEREIGRAHV